MIKCPNCGSTAQVKLLSAKYEEDDDMVTVSRLYHCGCDKAFSTIQCYGAIGEEEKDDFDW